MRREVDYVAQKTLGMKVDGNMMMGRVKEIGMDFGKEDIREGVRTMTYD